MQRQPHDEVRTRPQHREEEGSQISAASDCVFIALRARLGGRLEDCGRLRATAGDCGQRGRFHASKLDLDVSILDQHSGATPSKFANDRDLLLTQQDKIFFNVQYKNACLFQLQENVRRSIPLTMHKSSDSVLIGFQNIY